MIKILTPEYLDKIAYTNKIVQMYEELNTKLTKQIISKLKESGDLSSFTKSQLRTLAKRGGKEVFIEALNTTSALSSKRKKELVALFTEITKHDLKSYKTLYDYRGKEMQLSESQLKILNNAIKTTDKELKNFTKTIAFSSQQNYVDALDEMYLQVGTGAVDYQTAFRQTTNNLAEQGVKLPLRDSVTKKILKKKDGTPIYRSLEASVRQSVLYGVRQNARALNKDVGKYLGCDGVQINISPNCRDDHLPINGQVFKLNSRAWRRHKHLLNDFGCQHYESFLILDIEDNIYTQEEIDEANNRTVKYKGEEIPYYEATQKQRALERQIRNAKKTYMSSPTKENKANVSKQQANMRKYLKETGLERQYDREYFAGYNN